jgi:DNA-binding response OmpR family regulator
MNRPQVILLVDDDPEILEILGALFDAPGLIVLSVSDPYAAVRMLVERPVDLLITDVRMAELNGYELARQAKLMSPRLSVIYMSGGVTDDERGDGPVYGPLVLKPIDAFELMRWINGELSSASQH